MIIEKIFAVTPSFYPALFYGGPINSLYYLLKYLAMENNKVCVLTTNANGRTKLKVKTNSYVEIEKNLYVKYYSMGSIRGFSPLMFLGLWFDLRNTKLVYIQSIFSSSSVLAIFIAVIYGKKIILAPRGQLGEWCLQQGNRFKKIWLNIFIRPFIQKIFWHVTSIQEENEVNLLFNTKQTFLVPNGILLNDFINLQTDNKLFYSTYFENIKNNSNVIVSLGRIHKKKGYDILINAFSQILKHSPNSFLLIAGEDFGEKGKLILQIKELGLKEKVKIIDPIYDDEKKMFLSNADVFVLPSHNENFGIVYAEALAAGTPIVASKNTPWQEVEKAGCGRWINNTFEDTAEAIIDLLNRDRKFLRKNALKYVQKYDWKNIANKFKHCYETFI